MRSSSPVEKLDRPSPYVEENFLATQLFLKKPHLYTIRYKSNLNIHLQII